MQIYAQWGQFLALTVCRTAADYIISADRDLLDLKEYGGVRIVNARDYLDIVSA